MASYDKLNKITESLNPSNDLAVFTSVVARSVMLASVKSPILNIVSNAETLLTEGITNRVTTLIEGGQTENLVDKKEINDYIKYGINAYNASGFNISTTKDLNFEKLITGEKIITTQGKGKFKKLARALETGVFKYSMGYPDSVSKDLAFSDRASLLASNMSRKEGKGSERATELFKDAILIEPKTEEGQKIRDLSMAYAHKATFTDDSALSKSALACRDALNKMSGDLRAGDNLMPFVKTPANVVNIGLEYSVGVLKLIPNIDVIIKDVKKGELGDVSRKAVNSAVRNGVGLLVASLIAMALDPEDYIPAYEDLDFGERLLLKEKNVVFNSVKIGGKYISLDYLGPLGVVVAGILGARKAKTLTGAVGAYAGNVSSQLLRLPGIKDITELAKTLGNMSNQSVDKNIDEVKSGAINFISSRVIPAVVSDIAKSIDDFERDMSNDIWDKLKGKIPVLRETLPKQYSKTTGKAIESVGVLNMITGARVKNSISNKVIDEVERLKLDGESISLSDPTKYGKLKELDSDDKIDIRERFAREYAKRVNEVISQSTYKLKTDERKAKAINKVRSSITDKIKREYKNK